MSPKLSLGNFKWLEETSEFNEDFVKSYDDDNDDDSDDIFSKLISSTYKIYIIFKMIYHFYMKE